MQNIENKDLFPGQFIITRKPCSFGDTWQSISLLPDFFLSYSPSLTVRWVQACDAVVMGLVEEGDVNKLLITDVIASNLNCEQIKAESTSWVGRWVLIKNGVLTTDSWGSKEVYYYNLNRRDERIIGSTPGILNYYLNIESTDHDFGYSINEDPSEAGKYYRLLPEHLLDIEKGSVTKFSGSLFPELPIVQLHDIVDRIESLILNASRRLFSNSGKGAIYLPITGGRDSRLTATILRKALGTQILRGFTFIKPWYAMSLGDLILPRIVSKCLGISHAYIRHSHTSTSKIDQHFLSKALGTTKQFYENPGDVGYYQVNGYWDQLTKSNKNDVLITSLYYDLIEGTYANYYRDTKWFHFAGYKLSEHTFLLAVNRAEHIFSNFDMAIKKGVLYWSIRQASLGRLMSSLEVTGLEVFCPAICAEVNSLALALDRSVLVKSRIHKSIISKSSLCLKYLPYGLMVKELRGYAYYIRRYAANIRNLLSCVTDKSRSK